VSVGVEDVGDGAKGALGFLTAFGGAAEPDRRSIAWFAPVGALVGFVVGAVWWGAGEGWSSSLIAATVAVAADAAVTGMLHLDGLADSADGLGARDRERALAIMRDHSVGAYGTSALVLDLLLKSAALGALAERGEVLPVIAAFAVSRAAALPLAAALPYARPEGTGRALHGLSPRVAAAGLVLAVALAVPAPGTLVAAAAVVAAVGLIAHRRLGGVTGDVLGAAIELTATAALVAGVVGLNSVA